MGIHIKRLSRRGLAAVLSAVLCFHVVSSLLVDTATVTITDASKLGDIFHYNGIIFDHYEAAHSDMEGALAVGGTAKFGSGREGQFDVGAGAVNGGVGLGTYENKNGYPSLLLAGEPIIGSKTTGTSSVHIYGGNAVLAERLEKHIGSGNQFQAPTKVEYATNEAVDTFFREAYDTTIHMVSALNNAHSSTGANINMSNFVGWNTTYRQTFANLQKFVPDNLRDEVDGSVENTLVINVMDKGALILNGIQITSAFENYSYVVFNFPNATKVTFQYSGLLVDGKEIDSTASKGGKPDENAVLAKYASRMIWNFPQAKDITITSCGVTGSIVAPHAFVTGSGGSINGMLIANSFYTVGGCELHAFSMQKPKLKDRNTVTKGRVVLYKYDDDLTGGFDDYTLISGARFQLLKRGDDGNYTPYMEDDPNGYYDVDSTGRIVVEELDEGAYRFVEVHAPEGFEITDEQVDFNVAAGATPEIPIYCYVGNASYKYGKFTIRKVDAAGGAVLEGAIFELYLHNNENQRMLPVLVGEPKVTNSSGEATFDNLQEGRYKLVEVQAPEGYMLNPDSIEVQIDLHGPASVPDQSITYPSRPGLSQDGEILVIENEKMTTTDPDNPAFRYQVLLTKRLVDDDARPVEGAQYTLYWDRNYKAASATQLPQDLAAYQREHEAKGEQGRDWVALGTEATDELGHIAFQLEAGYHYKLEETLPPTGYELVGGSSGRMYLPDYAGLGQLGRDASGTPAGAPLSGNASPTQLQLPQAAVSERRSDPEPVQPSAESIPEVQSSQAETFNPGFFRSDRPVASGMGDTASPALIAMPLGTTGDSLAVVRLSEREGDIVVDSLPQGQGGGGNGNAPQLAPAARSASQTQLDDLPANRRDDASSADRESGGSGTPTQPASASPTQLPSFAPLAAPLSASQTQLRLSLYNQPSGKIKVIKKDNKTDAVLQGAEFGLYYNIGSGSGATVGISGRWQRIDTGFTDAHGVMVFEGLAPGEYRVMEITAPIGYEEITAPEPVPKENTSGEAETDYIVVLGIAGEDQDNFVFIARNPQAMGTLAIRKMDGDTGALLAGASFYLDAMNPATYTWYRHSGPYTTDENGEIEIPGLPFGKYRIVETSPPPGYTLDTQFSSSEIYIHIKENGYYSGDWLTVPNYRTPTTTVPPTIDTSRPDRGGGGGDNTDSWRRYVRDVEDKELEEEEEVTSYPSDDVDAGSGSSNVNPGMGQAPVRVIAVLLSSAMFASSLWLHRRGKKKD